MLWVRGEPGRQCILNSDESSWLLSRNLRLWEKKLSAADNTSAVETRVSRGLEKAFLVDHGGDCVFSDFQE